MNLKKYNLEGLKDELIIALNDENYELATKIRDEIETRDPNESEEPFKMNRDTQIKFILENLDFDKINSVMKFLGWTWHSGRTPTIEELTEVSEAMLLEVWDLDENWEHVAIETGGLKAERFIYDGVKILALNFILTGENLDYDTVIDPDFDTPED